MNSFLIFLILAMGATALIVRHSRKNRPGVLDAETGKPPTAKKPERQRYNSISTH